MLSPANRFCSPPKALRLIGPTRNCPLSPPPPQAHPWIPPPPPPLRSHHQGCSHLGKGRAGVLHDHHHAGPDKRTAEVVDDVLVTQGAQHLDLMQQLPILLRGHLQLLDRHQQPLAVHPEVNGAEPAGPEHGAGHFSTYYHMHSATTDGFSALLRCSEHQYEQCAPLARSANVT